MVEAKDFAGKKLEWTKKGIMDRNYELRSGGEVAATMSRTKVFGTLAEAIMGGTGYTLKRSGFLNPYITVRRAPFDEDVARMDMSIGGNGTLQLPDGKRYSFQKMSFWGFKWAFTDENGDLVLTVGLPSAWKNNGEIVVEQRASSHGHLPLLIVLGWYTAVQIVEESRTTAATAAGS